MLKAKLINSDIVSALAYCGHKDKVVIGSGNFPMYTKANPEAVKVNLALIPMVPTSSDIVRAIADMIPIEAAAVLRTENVEGPVEAHEEYKEALGMDLEVFNTPAELYERAAQPDVRLVIESADIRPFSNIILTIGCQR